MKNILITGGAGFIGSHVARLFVQRYANYRIVNLDKLTYAGNLENLKDIDSKRAKDYFGTLLETCGIAVPNDWKERILIGSDKKQSSTARENLVVDNERLPNELPETQKQLVQYAVPGLRELLGYTT